MGLISFDALTNSEIEAWHALRKSNPALDSPYFHPHFAAAVHASGSPVSVIVLRGDSGAVSALLPGHLKGGRLRPVGWPGADFQGPVLAPGMELSPTDFLVDGVHALEFDNLLSPTAGFEPWIIGSQPSPYLDTTGGLEEYLARASRSGKDKMAEARRCTAKAERTHGHVRFALDVVDDKVLDQLIALKRAQYEATGTRDYFGEQRRIELMHRLLHTRGSGFSGTLSTLHFGDHLAAAHFGIRSDHVLHWWFPVFERAYAKLSPGWILLREVIAAAPELGIDRIDLGWGDDDYKRRVQTGEVVVSRAVLTHSKTRRAVHHARHAIVEAVKNSPLGPRLSEATRILRGIKR